MPAGPLRPYNEVEAEIFLERLASGRSMLSISKDSDMPSWSTLWRWLDANEDFRNRYTRAREQQAHAIADEAIAEACRLGDDPADKRIAFDARRWFAGKVAPKHFGDKLQHTGADGSGPVIIETGVARDAKD